MKKSITLALAAITSTISLMAQPNDEWVTIKNGAAWMDTDGNMVQAHGAGFINVDGTWYMVGEDRSKSRPDINMYSSKDLCHWKFENKIVENGVTHTDLGRTRMIERPKIAYCANTGKYVVWGHWESSNYSTSMACCFYSDVVNGDYTHHWSGRPLNVKSRDCTLFVDNDGTAYFISTTSENTNLGLFRLSDDYLEVEEHTVLFAGQKREAPAVVNVDGQYYMLSSACSGWSPNQCKMSTSKLLKNGWTDLESVGNNFAYDTQPASILTIKGSKTTTYLFVGDRWQDPNLPESKTIIFPVTFENGQCQMFYRDQFDINFATGEWRETPTEGKRLDKSLWKLLECSSTDNEFTPGEAAFDNDLSTKWISKSVKDPQHIAIDLGQEEVISGFMMAHNVEGNAFGTMQEILFHTSLDGENWTLTSGASHAPYWGEVHFTPVKARYVKVTSLKENVSNTISEIELLCDDEATYTPIDITPRWRIGSKSWQNTTDITVEAGDKLTLSPQAGSMIGTWALETPTGYSTDRQLVIDSVTAEDEGAYNYSFIDAYSNTHLISFHVTVNQNEAGLCSVNFDPISTCYYGIDGVKTDTPRQGTVYIRVDTYPDATKSVSKFVMP